ncbi:MAG: glycosyltransferase family 39 protein, partial [Candidatus Hydrogenedentes bacterium]|nr:glycosyltransferase family 39 protein [Candidatus Hydrogenedentota bacterium]
MFSRPLFAQPDEYFFTLFRRCVIFILMATIFLAALMLFELQLPLQDDEALYWDMSRNLDLGYASKPPAIAYLIRISTTIFGHTEWAVRLPGTLLALAYLFVAYRLAYRLFHFSLAGWIVVYILLMDSQQLNNLIHITTNNLMYLFWILAIYFYWRALRRSKNGWFALGITLGLGFLSKYSMVFLLIPFLVHLTWYSPKQWRSRGIWVSLSIALVMNLGVIYWNFQLSWVSIKHTMKILENSNLESWSELLLGQILMIGPLPFVLYTIILLIMLYRRRSFPGGILLLMSSIIPILFYLYVASTRAIYPHWTYPGWIGATMGCGYYALVLNRYWPKYKHLLFSGFLVTFVLHITILIFAAVLILSGNMPHEKHPIKYKWPELWHARARYEDAPSSFIFSTSYGSAARLAYYSPGQPRVYCIEMLLQQEPNQYDVWGGWKSLVGSDAWLVEVQPAEVVLGFAAELVEGKAFSSYELMEVVEAVPARSLVEPASLPMTVVYMKNYLGKAPRQFIMERIQNSQDSENGARNMQRLAEITPKVANHLPLNLNAQKRSANVLLASGNKEKALIYLERTLSIERNPTEKLRLMEKTGLLLHDLGHDKKASAIFDVILENHSKNSVALETMGDISYEQAEYQQAAAYFTRLSTVSPEKTAKSAEYLVRIGRHWQEQENYSDAETAYSTAYRYSTDHAIALLFAGDIKREEKEYASALLYYTQFMGSEPESYEGAVRINTLIDKLGDEAQAIETWGEIAQQLPLSVLPHIYLGLAQEQKKDFENALVSFNTASKNSNTPRESHLYTATSLMLTGNINEGL